MPSEIDQRLIHKGGRADLLKIRMGQGDQIRLIPGYQQVVLVVFIFELQEPDQIANIGRDPRLTALHDKR